MNCSKCGAVLESGSKFCPKCGNVFEEQSVQAIPAAPVQPAPVAPAATVKPVPEKPKSKLPLVIIICVVVAIVALIAGILIGRATSGSRTKCAVDDTKEFKETDKDKEEDKDRDKGEETYSYNKFDPSKIATEASGKEELTKNIEILGYFRNDLKEPGKYEDVVIYGKNNNAEPVEVKLYLQFFDSNGKRIAEEVSHGNNMVKPNTEFIIDVDILDDTNDYSSVKLIYSIEKKKTYNTDVTINPSDIVAQKLTNGNIDVTITNNSDKEVTYGNCGYLFYKDGKVVYAASGYYENPIPVGGTSKSTFYGSSLTNGKFGEELKQIEYDDFKFVLFSAYFADSNY